MNFKTSIAAIFITLIVSIVLTYSQTVGPSSVSPPKVQVPPDNQRCIGCICEAISNCNTSLTCDGDVCGAFRITWPYWADAGKHVVNKEDVNSPTAYSHCSNDIKCAGTTVISYLSKFAQDCNGDAVIDCYDYALIHRFGGYGCKGQLSGQYLERFTKCLKSTQSSVPQPPPPPAVAGIPLPPAFSV